jgi:putative membrane protein
MITASLLVAACDGREATDETAGDGTGMMQTDAAGEDFAEQPPSAQGFAQAMAMSDMYEITAGKLALEKAEMGATREFAQMMVDDHTKSSQALKDAAGSGNQTFNMPASLDTQRQAQLDILERLDGADFDREYLSQQMAAHREALTLLKAYAGNGDVAELRQFAQRTIPTIQKHYDWLERNSTGAAGGATAGVPQATPAP